jgi:hypothetical protein
MTSPHERLVRPTRRHRKYGRWGVFSLASVRQRPVASGKSNVSNAGVTIRKVLRTPFKVKTHGSRPRRQEQRQTSDGGQVQYYFFYSMSNFPALPGAYKALFLYIEPGTVSSTHIYYSPLLLTRFNVVVTTILPAFLIWFTPGAAWFHHGLIPDPHESFASIDARTRMAIWQLGNCAFLSLFFVPS